MAELFKTENWYYRGEGNCSLVIANRKKHVVMRLLKRKKHKSRAGKKQKLDSECTLQKGITFSTNVMMPLVGHGMVQPGRPIELAPGFAEEIKVNVASSRPDHRLDKEVDSECSLGICLPDFCFLSPKAENTDNEQTLCVEIKPKCGFLPVCENISLPRAIKYSVCRFCMHQHLKVEETVKSGKWHERSYYCPIDLFSGNRCRMRHALRMLLQTPQNNLRLFKNGEIIWSQEVQENYRDHLKQFFSHTSQNIEDCTSQSAVDVFCDIIVDCLMMSLEETNGHTAKNGSDTNGHTGEKQTDSYMEARWDPLPVQHCQASRYPEHKDINEAGPSLRLPKGSVLHSVLEAQRLDHMDIEGVAPLYTKLQQHFQDNTQAREQSHIDGPYEQFWRCSTQNGTTPLKNTITKLKEYMVARTAKDCSIMLALSPLTSENHKPQDSHLKVVHDRHSNQFLVSVAVIDLDPKCFDKIPNYIQEDKNVVEFYLEVEKSNLEDAAH